MQATFRVLRSSGHCHLKGEILKGLVGRPSLSEQALSPYNGFQLTFCCPNDAKVSLANRWNVP